MDAKHRSSCFFILSGFVITYSLDTKYDNEASRFKCFLIDRFSRIYPPFLAALCFIFLLDSVSKVMPSGNYYHGAAFNLETFIGNVFMLQDFDQGSYFSITSFGSGRPLWTVSLEWWIYLFVAYIFLVSNQHVNKMLLLPILVFLSIEPLNNLFLGRGVGLFMVWVLGALCYYIYRNKMLAEFSKINIFLFFLFFFMKSVDAVRGTEGYSLEFSFYLAGAFICLIEILNRLNFPNYLRSFATIFASFSYSLYLIHYSIFDFLYLHFDRSFSMFLVGFVVSNGVAYAFSLVFEKSMTIFLRKVLKRKFT